MDEIQKKLIAEVADLHVMPEGAYNIRANSQLAARNTTMIIVTHEMAFARDVADHVIFMDGGKICEEGDPKEVFANPQQERTRQFLSHYNQ